MTSTAHHHDNVPRGILFMIAASALFAVSNAIAKWQVAGYPVGEIMCFRSVSSFIVCSAIVLPFTGLKVFGTKHPFQHLSRGLSQSISQTCTVLAVSMMPLAGVTAISFSAPLWSALLAIVWLREKANWARWTTLLVGFSGVLIVAHPGADSVQLGAFFALTNAIMYGTVTVAVRRMSKTESANTLLMWQLATLAVFHSTLLVFGFKWPTWSDGVVLGFSGVANVCAQYCWTQALRLAPTAAVTPFYYLILVWSAIIGFLGWGEIPTPGLLVGSAIVIAAGLLLLWHEGKKAKSAPPNVTAQATDVVAARS